MEKVNRKIEEKIRKTFDYSNIKVDSENKRIFVNLYINRNSNKNVSYWVPYSGGPLYGDQAVDLCSWLVNHITTYKELLPKSVRDFVIVVKKS